MLYQVIEMHKRSKADKSQGALCFAEAERDMPFSIRRIYYIYDVDKGVHRGFHSHKKNYQLLFCPYGSIEIIIDDGHEKNSVMLDDPSIGLVLYPGVWREMIWHQSKSVLCVAASEYYDENEYIRDYDTFLRYVAENQLGESE